LGRIKLFTRRRRWEQASFRRLRRARRLRLIPALCFGLIEPDDVNF
jgi:hypothetical protein